MTDLLLWCTVPTTIMLALAVDSIIALDLMWRFFISLNTQGPGLQDGSGRSQAKITGRRKPERMRVRPG